MKIASEESKNSAPEMIQRAALTHSEDHPFNPLSAMRVHKKQSNNNSRRGDSIVAGCDEWELAERESELLLLWAARKKRTPPAGHNCWNLLINESCKLTPCKLIASRAWKHPSVGREMWLGAAVCNYRLLHLIGPTRYDDNARQYKLH